MAVNMSDVKNAESNFVLCAYVFALRDHPFAELITYDVMWLSVRRRYPGVKSTMRTKKITSVFSFSITTWHRYASFTINKSNYVTESVLRFAVTVFFLLLFYSLFFYFYFVNALEF